MRKYAVIHSDTETKGLSLGRLISFPELDLVFLHVFSAPFSELFIILPLFIQSTSLLTPSFTHSHTHSHTNSLTHSSLTHRSLTLTLTHTQNTHTFTQILTHTHSLTQHSLSMTHTLIHSITHTPHSHTLQTMLCTWYLTYLIDWKVSISFVVFGSI